MGRGGGGGGGRSGSVQKWDQHGWKEKRNLLRARRWKTCCATQLAAAFHNTSRQPTATLSPFEALLDRYLPHTFIFRVNASWDWHVHSTMICLHALGLTPHSLKSFHLRTPSKLGKPTWRSPRTLPCSESGPRRPSPPGWDSAAWPDWISRWNPRRAMREKFRKH